MDNLATIATITTITTIATAGALLVNYYKYEIINRCFDMYVELFPSKKQPSKQPVAIDILSTDIHDGIPICTYTHNSLNYMALHVPPTTKLPLDPPEAIETINIVFHDETTATEEDRKYIMRIIASVAGYLCDFHGFVPSIETLQKITHPKLNGVKKITLNTTYWQEYICS